MFFYMFLRIIWFKDVFEKFVNIPIPAALHTEGTLLHSRCMSQKVKTPLKLIGIDNIIT